MSVEWLKLQFGEFDCDRQSAASTDYDRYGADVALEELWKNPQCKALVIEHIPAFADEEGVRKALPYSLRVIAEYGGDMLPPPLLTKLDALLKEIPVRRG